MKMIIAGPRDMEDAGIVHYAITECITKTGWNVTEVVSGGAPGVDSVSEAIARMFDYKITRFKANWFIYGKIAGPMRNIEMANYADGLLLIWRGDSPGSANMLKTAIGKSLPVCEYIYTTDTWHTYNLTVINGF